MAAQCGATGGGGGEVSSFGGRLMVVAPSLTICWTCTGPATHIQFSFGEGSGVGFAREWLAGRARGEAVRGTIIGLALAPSRC